MKRREFIGLLGSAAGWPLATHAQQAKVPRVGALVLGTADWERFWRLFREGLHELGYVEGRNIAFEFRSAQGKPNLLAALAAELVELKVDVIVTYQTPPAQAAKNATKDIPIVMAPAGDPVGTGLIASLARPGGNVTGLSGTTADLAGKALELIREVAPSANRVAILTMSASDSFAKVLVEQTKRDAQRLKIQAQTFDVGGEEELASAFADIAKNGAQGVIFQGTLPTERAANLALKYRLPTVSANRAFVEAGSLMSYSANYASLYREVATYVDKILKGAKPADLPVAQPTKYELVINLKTAKALGLTIPPTLLARADEVIE